MANLCIGAVVKILSVESCTSGLPREDQERLRQCVGRMGVVAEVDQFGFVWPAVDGQPAYFCVKPEELEVVKDLPEAI
jgi:hypothetical protein